MEEAVLVEDLCGSFWIVVVSEHYVRTLDADLAFTVFIRIVDLDTACQNRSTYASRLSVSVSVRRNQRRTFRDSITVQDGYSQRVEGIDDFFIKLCSATDY